MTHETPDGIFRVMKIVQDFYSTGIDEHPMVFILMILIFADVLSGVLRAWSLGNFSSRKLRTGLSGHFLILMTVLVGYPFALFMGFGMIMDLAISALFISYGLSFLKNMQLLGVDIPFVNEYIKSRVDNYKITPDIQQKIDEALKEDASESEEKENSK